MSRSAVTLIIVLAHCTTTSLPIKSSADVRTASPEVRTGDSDLAVALLSDDEVKANQIAAEILSGNRKVLEGELRDDRNMPPDIVLRTIYERRLYQLGTATVSDFTICLLQMKHHTSSANVLGEIDPSLKVCLTSPLCDVCNSHAFPVDFEVKLKLQDYWSSRLN
jgi:hypothetical protein